MINLDTHIVIFAIQGKLTDAERELMDRESWAISPMVLWEIAFLVKRRGLDLDLEASEFREFLARLEILNFNWRVAVASTELDFRSDPADEIIAASSVAHGIPLLTRDRRIRRSSMVPLAM